jgi:hypothetical protein
VDKVQQLSFKTDVSGNTGELGYFEFKFFLFILPWSVMFGKWCVCNAALCIILKSYKWQVIKIKNTENIFCDVLCPCFVIWNSLYLF